MTDRSLTGRSLPRWSAPIALGCALWVWAPVARADAHAEAAALFEQGRALRKQGDCPGALPFFRKAYDVYPDGLGSLRNIAECEEVISDLASAYDAWVALKRALVTHVEPKYVGWDRDAQDAEARLGAQLAKVGLIPGATAPPAVPAPSTSRASSVPEASPALPASSLATGAASGGRSHDDSPAHTAGWVAIGVGAAAAVGLAVSFGVRQHALNEVTSQCPSHMLCDPSLESVADRGRTASTLVYVFTGIAAAGVVTGIVLLTVAGPHTSAAFWLSPSGGFATLTF